MNFVGVARTLAWSSALFVLVACGGDDTAPTGIALEAFITEYCSLTAKCCGSTGGDASECASSFSALESRAPSRYDAAGASTCLARLRDAKACDFYDAQDACTGVLTEAGGNGSVPVGSPCKSSPDCAASAEGVTSCFGINGDAPRCRVTVDGAEGAACDGTKNGRGVWFLGPGPGTKDRVVVCDQAAGLVCGGPSSVCFRRGDAGAACSTSADCSSERCHAGACQARAAVGGSCQSASCVEAAYCDDAQLCADKLPPGAACATSGQCLRGDCDGGRCSTPTSWPPLGCYSRSN